MLCFLTNLLFRMVCFVLFPLVRPRILKQHYSVLVKTHYDSKTGNFKLKL